MTNTDSDNSREWAAQAYALLKKRQEEKKEELQKQETALFMVDSEIDALETKKYFSRENDLNNAYLDIQSGSGGTEAQDWAEMLFRMYSRWAEEMNFKVKIEEYSSGDVAGIKSASIHISGTYAYGWLRTETGIHRLVRKSPFDSGNRLSLIHI